MFSHRTGLCPCLWGCQKPPGLRTPQGGLPSECSAHSLGVLLSGNTESKPNAPVLAPAQPTMLQLPSVSTHGRRIPKGNGRDGYGQPCAIPPLQQHREKHRESGRTPSLLTSRANKGKSRRRGTKPYRWNGGRSGEGAEVTPLAAGNSIPCYSPAWDLPFLFDPFTTSMPWKLAKRQEAWRTLAWRKIPQKEFLYRSKFNKTTTNCLL